MNQMGKLTKEDVLKLAKLSKLKLTNLEVAEFQKEISEVLSYVEMLSAVDVKGLEPTYQVTGLSNVTRSDKIRVYGPTPRDLLKNLPARDGDYVKTKRIL